MFNRTIRSWTDLLEALYAESWSPAIQRFRSPFAFRGLSRSTQQLSSSLVRLADGRADAARLEMALLRNFRKYAHTEGVHADSVWDWMALGQHRGLPTRLLDWTYSPLVAAHFATVQGAADADRAVWRLDWKEVHRRFRLPELALLIQDLEGIFGGDRPCTPSALFAMPEGSRPFACMLEPPSLDARIVAQSAAFTLCSEKRQTFDDFLERHGLGGALTKIVIPAQHAGRIRDQLDLVSVDERRLFPDLDGVAAYLKRYYS